LPGSAANRKRGPHRFFVVLRHTLAFVIHGTEVDLRIRVSPLRRQTEACRSSVPSFDKRIYSVNYVHDGVEWTATVGETLRGVGRKTVRRREQKFEGSTSHSDPATVRAIFGVTDKLVTVMTDGHLRTQWGLIFHCEPRHVTFFSQPEQGEPDVVLPPYAVVP
jgi:hypothetical protein